MSTRSTVLGETRASRSKLCPGCKLGEPLILEADAQAPSAGSRKFPALSLFPGVEESILGAPASPHHQKMFEKMSEGRVSVFLFADGSSEARSMFALF